MNRIVWFGLALDNSVGEMFIEYRRVQHESKYMETTMEKVEKQSL